MYIFLLKVASKGDGNEKLIVFFKTKPDVITPDNLHSSVFVSSMLDSPVSALYHAVQKVRLVSMYSNFIVFKKKKKKERKKLILKGLKMYQYAEKFLKFSLNVFDLLFHLKCK